MPRPPGRSNKHVRRLVHDAICDPPRVLVCRVARRFPSRHLFLPYGRAVLWDDPGGVTLDYEPVAFSFRDPFGAGACALLVLASMLTAMGRVTWWLAACAGSIFAVLVYRVATCSRLPFGGLSGSLELQPGAVETFSVTTAGVVATFRMMRGPRDCVEPTYVGLVLSPVAPATVDDVVSLFERLSNAPQGEPQRQPPLGE